MLSQKRLFGTYWEQCINFVVMRNKNHRGLNIIGWCDDFSMENKSNNIPHKWRHLVPNDGFQVVHVITFSVDFDSQNNISCLFEFVCYGIDKNGLPNSFSSLFSRFGSLQHSIACSIELFRWNGNRASWRHNKNHRSEHNSLCNSTHTYTQINKISIKL